MRTFILVLFFFSACFISSSQNVLAGNTNAINLGVAVSGGVDIFAMLIDLEYEKLLFDRLSILGRVGVISTEYDDGDYEENGDMQGLEVGTRFYPAGKGLKGFYIGGAVGLWFNEWDWVDDIGASYQTSGDGKTTAIDLNVNLGWKIPLGSHFHIEPNFVIGSYLGVETECNRDDGAPCNKDSELGAYGAIKLNIGFGF